MKLLNSSARAAVVTGFFVPAAGAAETDGPGGAAVLARAFSRSGRECRLFTDPLCFSSVDAVSEAIGGVTVQAVEVAEDILAWGPDLIVFVERLGRAADGCFYNMRGEDISVSTCPLDLAACMAKEEAIPVLAVGDGGNEVGMGRLGGELSALLPGFVSCLCCLTSNALVPVDVSNWGAYALAALLSAEAGRWLGHSQEEEESMLQALVLAGAVDGVTLRSECSVDGFDMGVQKEIVRGLADIWRCFKISEM